MGVAAVRLAGHRLLPIVASLAGVLMLGACSFPPDPPLDGAVGVPRNPDPGLCQHGFGGECLGPLRAGRHTTTAFQPRLTYTVPAGWRNEEDLPGNVLLVRDGDEENGLLGGNFVGVYQGVRAAAQNCLEEPEPGVGSSALELTDWMRSLPGIVTSEPKAVVVGGLAGYSIDVRIDPVWTTTCPWSGDTPAVALVIGWRVSRVHHTSFPGLSTRFIVLDWEASNVLVEITSVDDRISADAYRAEAEPITRSFSFGT